MKKKYYCGENLILIFTYIMFAAGIGQRTYERQVLSGYKFIAMFNHVEILFI